MYESPIDIICSEMQIKLENKVLTAVQNVGINVDKDELIKALSYDRQQYKKGYADAKKEQQWNEFSPDDERLKDHYFYLISHKNYDTPIKAKWHEEGYWTEPFTRETLYWRHDEDTRDNVSAWMYLPEKYKGDGDDQG